MDVLNELNIDLPIEENNDYYIVDLNNYDTFNQVYNTLEKSMKYNRNSDYSSLDEESAHIQYEDNNTVIELLALFDDDSYTLNIQKDN